MAKYELLLPKMGESVAEATIIRWLKSPGDTIEADEAIMEIATDKVDSEVPSPVSGKLVKQLCNENDVVQVGSVIAEIETGVTSDSNHAPTPVAAPPTPAPQYRESFPANDAVEFEEEPIPGINQLKKEEPVIQAPTFVNNDRFYSPLVKNIAQQENISTAELDRIPGTGADGRLTKDDLLNYINRRQSQQNRPAPAPQQQAARPQPAAAPQQAQPQQQRPAQPAAPQAAPAQAPKPAPQPAVSQNGATPAQPKPAYVPMAGDEIIEMDRMRRLIADHMVMSKHTSPHVTSFVEADVTNLVKWRDKIKKDFEGRTGERITFTPIFIEAVVKAIKDFPLINSSINGTQIIKKKDINIGMATALPSGNLIVPVIHRADTLNLTGMTKSVNDLANRARANKLQPDEVKNGTFTLTNVGSFGNVMGTPIINQPQVAILAIGIIKKKPAVLETKEGDVIAIRHMMFLSLSYDHRVVDGALGGSFVRRVADYLENWDMNREI
ncbi:2-oxo acid dehydrogenase subunit E2 [Mucilaginibacter mali]|uniref:Dihydrolipoamide acetyltransferase component of pyruvate dehydrogenase complex n=1 Tax=Mucilaginibacter mali TaxID=2740462 RepID=A0A7D4PTT8_9SPHI|nr:dihydrolipoamide acetyltransferase family protein [Mucilaginibacter mali]QKJ29963.1 2-oxo acid dehydrogenase subunit E2 [Mucilaginibacter mali]